MLANQNLPLMLGTETKDFHSASPHTRSKGIPPGLLAVLCHLPAGMLENRAWITANGENKVDPVMKDRKFSSM